MKQICKKCGKTGEWVVLPGNRHQGVLEHYCPVAYAEKPKPRKINDIPAGLKGFEGEIKWLQENTTSSRYQKIVGYEWKIRKLTYSQLEKDGFTDPTINDLLADSREYDKKWREKAEQIWEHFKVKKHWLKV